MGRLKRKASEMPAWLADSQVDDYLLTGPASNLAGWRR
jgi:hypothetical protein